MLEGGNFYGLKRRNRIMVTSHAGAGGELECEIQVAV